MKFKVFMMSVLLVAFFTVLNAETVRTKRGKSFEFKKDDKVCLLSEVSGVVNEYSKDSVLVGVFNYKDGKLDGFQKEYYADGKTLRAEYNMTSGMRNGMGKEYFEDGKVLSFSRDLKDGNGIGTEYYPDGNMVKRLRLYKDGKQIKVSLLNEDLNGKSFDRDEKQYYAQAQQYAVEGKFYHAIDNYNKFMDKYPESELTPNVKFLIAFTYNNQLSDIENARKNYSEFIAKYPNHKLTQSAEFELKTLGKSLDDMPEFQRSEKKN